MGVWRRRRPDMIRIRGKTRIPAKIHHKLIDPLHGPTEVMIAEAKADFEKCMKGAVKLLA